MFKNVSKEFPVICWWSGGITSAVTCWFCIKWFGCECVRVVFIDTGNEDESTWLFMRECEKWYGVKIEIIKNERYRDIQQVWYDNTSLNVATGAKCSSELKRIPRERFEKDNKYSYQAFGFEIEEIKRAKSMKLNSPNSRPIFPLIYDLLTKNNCIKIIQQENNLFHPLTIPKTYQLGYNNNNCWNTGCVQGGIGYWQKIQKEFPEKFAAMAKVEHDLTDKKGQPVTMLKDQGKDGGLVFLLPHPDYPEVKDISMMKGRPPKPLMDCNGFCGTNDLIKNETEQEINFSIVTP